MDIMPPCRGKNFLIAINQWNSTVKKMKKNQCEFLVDSRWKAAFFQYCEKLKSNRELLTDLCSFSPWIHWFLSCVYGLLGSNTNGCDPWKSFFHCLSLRKLVGNYFDAWLNLEICTRFSSIAFFFWVYSK